METPPHTWRKFLPDETPWCLVGNTSTYVEKICLWLWVLGKRGKHLHIRGENSKQSMRFTSVLETPPHTWRKFIDLDRIDNLSRNTSTYVEKIASRNRAKHKSRKHLHIRGENSLTSARLLLLSETPPHTWRKFDVFDITLKHFRNTSTYVEKLRFRSCFYEIFRKHLHIRGENSMGSWGLA